MIISIGFVVALIAFLVTASKLHEAHYRLGQAEAERDAYEHTIDMMGWELISTAPPRTGVRTDDFPA